MNNTQIRTTQIASAVEYTLIAFVVTLVTLVLVSHFSESQAKAAMLASKANVNTIAFSGSTCLDRNDSNPHATADLTVGNTSGHMDDGVDQDLTLSRHTDDYSQFGNDRTVGNTSGHLDAKSEKDLFLSSRDNSTPHTTADLTVGNTCGHMDDGIDQDLTISRHTGDDSQMTEDLTVGNTSGKMDAETNSGSDMLAIRDRDSSAPHTTGDLTVGNASGHMDDGVDQDLTLSRHTDSYSQFGNDRTVGNTSGHMDANSTFTLFPDNESIN